MSLFSSQKKKDIVALFDIGTSSVGGALIMKDSKNIPTIIFFVREPIKMTENFDFDRFFSYTMASIEKVAHKINLSGVGAPNKIYCTLSSPWYASQTRSIKLEKNTNFIFNSKLASDLNKKEFSLFEQDNNNVISDAHIIETKNMSVSLNGYRVQKPLGMKAKKVEMSLFLSMVEKNIITKIEESIGRYLHFKNIKFSSFIFSSFTTLRDVFSKEEDFIFMDIGGEITEIGMVKKDILLESVSFPYGKNFILRSLSKKIGHDIAHTKSLFNLYLQGHLEKKNSEKIKKELDIINLEWLKQLGISLNALSNHILLPHTIFVLAEQDMISFFSEIIKKEESNQYTKTISKFKIIPIDTKILHGQVIFEKETKRDVPIITQSIYINRYNK
jgi:hypothetical protein